jgi:hypothetical protein
MKIYLLRFSWRSIYKPLLNPGLGSPFPAAAVWGMAYLERNPGCKSAAIFGAKAGHLKTVIVVDEDIDPFDLNQVWWAVTARLQASKGVSILTRGKGAFMDPSQLK